ncbi:MAG: hypothetical protein AB7O66_11800 [Limisphaerales bacterium]
MTSRSSSSGGDTPGPAFGPGRGLVVVAGLLFVVVVANLWSSRTRGSRDGPGSEGWTNGRGGVAGAAEVGALEDPGRGTGAKRRPFLRSERQAPVNAGAVPWQSRIRNNGFVDSDLLATDPDHRRRAHQSNRLRVMLESPARDTPEFGQVMAFVERRGLPLAATVDLYNMLWAARGHEVRMSEATDAGTRDSIDLVQGMEMSDFGRRFRSVFDVDVEPLFEEISVLGIRPTVFMRLPSAAFVSGEPLLTE